jgi:hypothetical protein
MVTERDDFSRRISREDKVTEVEISYYTTDPVETVWVNVRGGPQIGHEFGSPRMS